MREITPYDDLQELRKHPLIREYASVDDEIYEVIKATNPMLRMFIDLAKEIMIGITIGE